MAPHRNIVNVVTNETSVSDRERWTKTEQVKQTENTSGKYSVQYMKIYTPENSPGSAAPEKGSMRRKRLISLRMRAISIMISRRCIESHALPHHLHNRQEGRQKHIDIGSIATASAQQHYIHQVRLHKQCNKKRANDRTEINFISKHNDIQNHSVSGCTTAIEFFSHTHAKTKG